MIRFIIKGLKNTTVLVAITFLLFFMASCGRNFEGTIIKNDSEYFLQATYMDGNDEHIMRLEKGSVLKITFQTEDGDMNLEIKSPSGASIYSGNGTNATDFTLNVSKSGYYAINVSAHRAKGVVQIKTI